MAIFRSFPGNSPTVSLAGLILIPDVTVDMSGGSTAIIGEGFLTDEFDQYIIDITEAVLSASTIIAMKFKQGGAVQSSSYFHHEDGSNSGSALYAGAVGSGSSDIRVYATSMTGNASFKIYIPKPASIDELSAVSFFGSIVNSTLAKRISGTCSRDAALAIQAVEISVLAGTFTAGTIRLYGEKK